LNNKKTKSPWIINENDFDQGNVRKYESILCQGNGYMGVRAVTEETYPRNTGQIRIAGTFDRAENAATTELPICADLLTAKIEINGEVLELSRGNFSGYTRSLNLQNGLLERSFRYHTACGTDVGFRFERFVSLYNKHVLGQRIYMRAENKAVKLTISTGIGVKRNGDNHFSETFSEVFENIIQFSETTMQSGIEFTYTKAINISVPDRIEVIRKDDNSEDGPKLIYEVVLPIGCELAVEKIIRIATNRDLENINKTPAEIREQERGFLEAAEFGKFAYYFKESALAWAKVWAVSDVRIDSENTFDQLALRFAVYHLTIMAPVHDPRMNIGAKGLSGKGYHGHTFWDTEIYMLPYFIHTAPNSARSLLEYRYHCLGAARQKAKQYGYRGAMYPWEAAWIDDVEACPDLKFAEFEHHITACVSYGVYYYYEMTKDIEFMLRYGCEIIFYTAIFWCSRLEFNEQKQRYEITDVIGPDEFTHHANNNAFTNYLAHLNIRLAIRWHDILRTEHPHINDIFSQRFDFMTEYPIWVECAEKLYLPSPLACGILPQDDNYMSFKEIDLTPYRSGYRKLRKDYPYPSYSELKVSKQADVMVLFILLEDEFAKDVKSQSFYYYEPFCVHESSLSLCAYSILSADVGQDADAYALYERACRIDLGEKMDSSNDGIHAASLGGIWQCSVFGFLGIRLLRDGLRIAPRLPLAWNEVSAKMWYLGQLLEFTANHRMLTVEIIAGSNPLSIKTPCGVKTVDKKMILDYKNAGTDL